MKDKITRNELKALAIGLKNVSTLPGVKFAYAVAKNLRTIGVELKDASSSIVAFEASAEFLKMESDRIKLCESHSELDDIGKPKMVLGPTGQNYIIADQTAFDKALKELREVTHAETQNKHKAIMDDYNNLMAESIEFELYKVPLSAVPENITAALISAIMTIIEEEP